jgi:predicted nucleic acid-binding protein
MRTTAAQSINLLIRDSKRISVIPQNLIEFWAVATRPESSNGLGLSVGATAQIIAALKTAFELLPDTDAIFNQWEQLVVRHSVSGKQVYDARLVAAMLVHNLTHLLIFNVRDFKRFTEITAVNPQNIV